MKFLLFLLAGTLFAQDPREIMSRAMEREARNIVLRENYMYERRTLQRHYDKSGSFKETSFKVHEVFQFDGSEIERLIEKNGKPLSEKEQAEEQKRVDREMRKIREESPKQRAKRRGETEKDRRDEIEARREVVEAFHFTLLGEDTLRGRKCWKIRGDPKPGYKPKNRRSQDIKKISGIAWVDQETYECTRVELDTSDTISFGWFLLRLQPGAHVLLEQTLINNEVWLPAAMDIRADARLLGKMLRIGYEVRYGNYRKFSSDSKLVVGEQ